MPSPRATITQSEVARLAKGMRAAGIDEFSIKVEKPDGTKVSIVAGKGAEAADAGDDIDKMIERVPDATP